MTKSRVAVVDYGVGNLLSVSRALEHCGAAVTMASDVKAVRGADRLVLPGVGAFGDCMAALVQRGLEDAVREVIAAGHPVLGICVGMQILLDASEEFGVHRGLGVIPGRVTPIPVTDTNGCPHKIPHIGWTSLEIPAGADAGRWRGTVLEGLAPGVAAYFVHSFTAEPIDSAHRLADSWYGGRRIAAAVQRDNLFGTQFHPEKSGPVGLSLLRRFTAL